MSISTSELLTPEAPPEAISVTHSGNGQVVPKIFGAILGVMRDLGAIGKGQQAPQYKFRGIDDVYNELHDHLAKHGVFTVPTLLAQSCEERTTKSGTVMTCRLLTIRYRFYAEDGSYIDAVVLGEGQDTGDKAANKAMSVAHKYCLIQVLAIPTAEPKDPEIDHEERRPAAPRPRPAPKAHLPVGYSGTEPQKRALLALLKEIGVTDGTLLIPVHEAMLGEQVAMGDLGTAIRAYLNKHHPKG